MRVRSRHIDALAFRSVALVMGGGGEWDARDHADEQHEQQQMVCAT